MHRKETRIGMAIMVMRSVLLWRSRASINANGTISAKGRMTQKPTRYDVAAPFLATMNLYTIVPKAALIKI